VHVRRDFIGVARDWPALDEWGMSWVEKIGQLYFLNKQRLQPKSGSEEFNQADVKLREAINQMKKDRDQQLCEPGIHRACKKVLKSLSKHWSGLTLFVDYPWIPMDNNRGENTLRDPVLGRKNYYGSGSLWSAALTARMFTVIYTIELWGINSRLWLEEYLEACAKNGGRAPDDTESFLPWKMSDEQLEKFGADPKKTPAAKPHILTRRRKCDTVEENSPKRKSGRSGKSSGNHPKKRGHP